jgi:hypothetical protein
VKVIFSATSSLISGVAAGDWIKRALAVCGVLLAWRPALLSKPPPGGRQSPALGIRRDRSEMLVCYAGLRREAEEQAG